jgi:hypothetical protein
LQALATRTGAVDRLITLSVNSAPSPEALEPGPKLFRTGSSESGLLIPGSAHAQAIFDGEQGGRALQAILTQVGAGT